MFRYEKKNLYVYIILDLFEFQSNLKSIQMGKKTNINVCIFIKVGVAECPYMRIIILFFHSSFVLSKH